MRRTLPLLLLLLLGGATTASAAAPDPWVTRALILQHELAGDLGARDAPTVGTHNSFNSPATVGPSLSAQDANQRIGLVDQLELGVRSLELDLHTVLNPAVGAAVPTVCHAQPGGVGCTTEPPFAPVLQPVADWVHLHPDQVVLLYLEDDLGDAAAHDSAAATLDALLGDRIYRPAPAADGCGKLPLDLSRDAIRAAGKSVLIVSDCGPGTGWNRAIFDWSGHFEARPIGFEPFPACGPKPTRAVYDSQLVRFFEDSTLINQGGAALGLLEADDGLTPATLTQMTRCGVDLVGLDQLVPGDPRLEALVWSWARDEPAAIGACAIQRVGSEAPAGRWYARPCAPQRHRAACRTAGGRWLVSRRGTTGGTRARAACRRLNARLAAPRTGYEAQLLKTAMDTAGTGATWLGLRRTSTAWRGTDPR